MRILALVAFLYAGCLDDRARAWFALAIAAFLVLYDIAATLAKLAKRTDDQRTKPHR